MERIEEFIRKNREALDKFTPSPDIWEGIRKDLRNSRINLIRWLSVAAMIVVIITTAALFYAGENKRGFLIFKKKTEAILFKINPQLRETEIYYSNQVNELYSEASPLLTGYPDIEKELINDFSQIDSICTDIKRDLRDNVANQEVIEALINNYRIKIHILEDMLVLLKQDESNTEKNVSHEL